MKEFNPHQFVLTRSKRHGLVMESKPIDWSTLDETQCERQFSYCQNKMWEYEKEGVIKVEDIQGEFLEYVGKLFSKDAVRRIKKQNVPYTTIALGYLLKQGATYKKGQEFFKKRIETYLAIKEIQEVEEEKPKIRPSIQDAMKEKLIETIGTLDVFTDNALQQPINVFNWLTELNVPRVHCDPIIEYYKPILAEIELAISGTDSQVNEGYSRYTKTQLKKLRDWYQKLISDAETYKRAKHEQRKPRAKKPKSPLKLVNKLRYLKEEPELNITSIRPETIIGCDQLWTYNVKTHKLICYTASALDKQLTVKGTYIVGWDPKLSTGKNLRKPVEQLKELLSDGKVHMRKFIEKINGKQPKLNGKINPDTLLLKVF